MTSKLLVPAVPVPVVPRLRLHERLAQGVGGPLTLVSAPAGSGKTVLASSWAASCGAPGPVVWISLDEEDDAAGIFWSYVLAGLRRAGVDVSGVGQPDRVNAVAHSLLVRLAAAFSEGPDPVVLVLDNAEGVTRQQITDGLDFLLRHAAGRLRLVVVTRVDPNLPLPQYRLEGAVTEIRFAELAFTPEEARDLLAARRPDLSDGAVLAFSFRTRGWAAGLKLAGVARATDGPGADGAGHCGNDLAAYFRSEVLDTQPAGVRDFLLRTSVVDRLTPDLAVRLSRRADAGATLRALAQGSVFVDPADGAEEVYTYHPLVRDLLRAQLAHEAPVRKRRLHREAARWLADAGRTTEAIQQHVAAEEWESACALLVTHAAVARLLAGTADSGLGEILSGLPGRTPGLDAAVVGAALALLRGDIEGCDRHLSRAEELRAAGFAGVAGSAGHQPCLSLAVALIVMTRAAACGQPDETLAAAARAQDVVADADVATTALVLFCLGRSRLAKGELRQAQGLLAAAAGSAEAWRETRPLQARALANLALAQAVSGDLDGAVNAAGGAAEAARAPAGLSGSMPDLAVPVAADVALAWVCVDRLDLAGGRSHLEAVGRKSERFSDPLVLTAGTLVRSRLLRAEGDLSAAARVLARGRDRLGQTPVWLARQVDADEAMLLVAQGRPEIADDRVRRHATEDVPACLLAHAWAKLSTGAAGESGRVARQVIKRGDLPLDLLVEAHLLVAASAAAMSRPQAASTAVDEAARLASACGLRRPLEQAPPRLRALLHQLEAPRPARAIMIEPLTEREHEVLAYLDALLPTEEIAARMFVSVNTVKTHVRAILRKLAAERRYEAVRRARDLGLI